MKKMLILLTIVLSAMVATDATAIGWQKRCVKENEQKINDRKKQMESNHHIGEIDTLMLNRLIAEKGYSAVKKEIKWHMFDGYMETYPEIYFQTPFSIEHRCVKNDGSELSDKVFAQIHRTSVLELGLMIKNPLNVHNQNIIDECATWESIQNSEDVLVTSEFHNKKALVVALNKLRN